MDELTSQAIANLKRERDAWRRAFAAAQKTAAALDRQLAECQQERDALAAELAELRAALGPEKPPTVWDALWAGITDGGEVVE